jgi:capsule polysaccharide export protein KpsE/RkpR
MDKPTEYQLRENAYHIQGIDDQLDKIAENLERIARRDFNLYSQDQVTEINKKLKKLHQKIARFEIDLYQFYRKEIDQ